MGRNPFPEGFDGPRPLRPGFAGRLEAELASPDAAVVAAAMAQLDAPRPLPPDLDARLEASLAAGKVVPMRLRRRLVRTVAPREHRPAGVGGRWGVAALLLIVLGMSSVAYVTGGGPVERVAQDFPPGVDVTEDGGFRVPVPEGESGETPLFRLLQIPGVAAVTGDDGEASSVQVAGPGLVTTGPTPAGGAAAAGQVLLPRDERGQKPPFATGPMDDASVALGSPAPASLPPVRIAVLGGGTEFGEGFAAYTELLNESGGVRRRPFRLVPVTGEKTVRDVVAVVNAGETTVADALPARPLVEQPRAPEAALSGDVFSFTSVLERQAHLAVLGAFPEPPPPGAQAVLYEQEGGAYGGRVAGAMREALDTVGAAVLTVAFDPQRPVLLPGTAAFLALDASGARAFLTEARRQGYAPEAGIWGVESLFDSSLLGAMNGAVRVASPFAPASSAEMDAIAARTGRFTAETVAGWVAAKAMAVAVWRSGAATAGELSAALHGLASWRTPFLPPYEVREGSTSRTPEAITLRVSDGAFAPVGEFRRDPL